MEIVEVTSKDYSNIIHNPYHVFSSATFNDLNKEKCKEVFYLLFKDKKIRLGIIGGIKENSFYSPFSAPFGGFVYIKKDIKIQVLDEAINLLIQWSISKGLKTIQITLPPSIYEESFISKLTNSFFRNNFNTEKIDLNYSFYLKNFDQNYSNSLWRSARKNLRIAFSKNLNFKICESKEEKELAYIILKKNRESRGYPLRMTWEQIKETIKLIDVDFFLLGDDSNEAIAAAMIFYVSSKIVQVIYWGDLPEFSHLKTMNLFSYKIFEFYKKTAIRIVDVGPSTENSVPNFGLCEFKESIGCNIRTKLTLIKKV